MLVEQFSQRRHTNTIIKQYAEALEGDHVKMIALELATMNMNMVVQVIGATDLAMYELEDGDQETSSTRDSVTSSGLPG